MIKMKQSVYMYMKKCWFRNESGKDDDLEMGENDEEMGENEGKDFK